MDMCAGKCEYGRRTQTVMMWHQLIAFAFSLCIYLDKSNYLRNRITYRWTIIHPATHFYSWWFRITYMIEYVCTMCDGRPKNIYKKKKTITRNQHQKNSIEVILLARFAIGLFFRLFRLSNRSTKRENYIAFFFVAVHSIQIQCVLRRQMILAATINLLRRASSQHTRLLHMCVGFSLVINITYAWLNKSSYITIIYCDRDGFVRALPHIDSGLLLLLCPLQLWRIYAVRVWLMKISCTCTIVDVMMFHGPEHYERTRKGQRTTIFRSFVFFAFFFSLTEITANN